MTSIRKRLKRWLYGTCPGIAGAFPYFGTRVHFPRGSLCFVAACEQGIYEQDNVRILVALVRPGTWYLDVGANIGLMSLPVLQSVNSCRVVSFEASPNALPYLAKTIAGSAYPDRWTLVPQALGAADGRVEFSLSSPENSPFDGIQCTQRVAVVRKVEVQMTTLDHWWCDAGRPEVSAIKCDVEGAEIQVLQGARECLARDRPHVLLEWNRTNIAAYGCQHGALVEFAKEARYSLYALPHLVRVWSEGELNLQTIATESFLMCPDKPVL